MKWYDSKMKLVTQEAPMGCGIVYMASLIGKSYKVGHFLLKTEKGWMDPWKTGKTINEAQAGYRRILPGKKSWVIETIIK